MITAVEEQRQRGRERSRSAVSGPEFNVPEFSVPAMSGIGDMLAMAPLPSANVCAPVAVMAAPPAPPAASLDLTDLLGRSVGSGQCVALVRAAQPAVGPTATWQAGASIQGNAALVPGTPIATFDGAGRYANATDGSSHAAVYLGQDARGMTVLDQWAGSAASVRTIPWTHPDSVAANTGKAFRVITSG